MIQIPQKLISNDLKTAKKASYAIGVVTKEGKITEGAIYDDSHTPSVPLEKRLFEIGSTTKTFTSLLLAKLVLDDELSLDEPITSFLPEYKKALSFKDKEVTFRHLATHSSRLPREDMKTLRKILKENKENRNNIYWHYTLEHFNNFFIQHDLKKEIGRKWGYSNIGVGLLGYALSKVAGMDYEKAVTTHVLRPLGMKDTVIEPNQDQFDRYVTSYNKKGKPLPPLQFRSLHGAGAFRSTMEDMMIYLEHQMGMRESSLHDAINFTHQNQGVRVMKGMNMGLSWFIEERKWSEYPIIHHGGTTIGFHTYFGFIKELQIGVVMFSTIQLGIWRLLKMLLRLAEGVNENVAIAIFKEYGENNRNLLI
ncbi:CubicO group peptidase, beta-lactamase class C family [Gracilibacillus ureilyticus]|uniref:CubicO group peptidase, beta-lactamase class C family n=1 Tax=Gracilibacillus ureilyticus TaxID=531814 RepID=A0A1H9MPE4_9BACI|nr:serine hydrolase domain-containing protein [Gracilibacillus ureilyticus]SER25508.1 CubicO group peptidase, beta-lactamase class C family [Gracilibacillus ureilyticus]